MDYAVDDSSITAIVSVSGQDIENARANSQCLRHGSGVGALLEDWGIVILISDENSQLQRECEHCNVRYEMQGKV